MKNCSRTIKVKLLSIIQWSLKDIYLTVKVHNAILYGFSTTSFFSSNHWHLHVICELPALYINSNRLVWREHGLVNVSETVRGLAVHQNIYNVPTVHQQDGGGGGGA